MSKRVSFLVLSVVASLLLAAAAFAAASPFSFLSKKSKSQTVNVAGDRADVKPSCGSKSRVSGGFNIGKIRFDHGPIVDRSRAVENGWQTGGSEYTIQVAPPRSSRFKGSSGAPARGTGDQIAGDVYCAGMAPKITSRSKTTKLHRSQVKSLVAKCRPGTQAIAGGFKTNYDGGEITGVIVTTSRKAGQRGWKVVGTAVYNPGVTKLTAYAYCAKAPKLEAVSARDTGKPSNPHPSATATCPTGRFAVSGGFSSKVKKTGDFLLSNIPEASRLQGDSGWKTRAYYSGFDGDGPVDWTTYVYCTG